MSNLTKQYLAATLLMLVGTIAAFALGIHQMGLLGALSAWGSLIWTLVCLKLTLESDHADFVARYSRLRD